MIGIDDCRTAISMMMKSATLPYPLLVDCAKYKEEMPANPKMLNHIIDLFPMITQ
jgi:hypothetical protein